MKILRGRSFWKREIASAKALRLEWPRYTRGMVRARVVGMDE